MLHVVVRVLSPQEDWKVRTPVPSSDSSNGRNFRSSRKLFLAGKTGKMLENVHLKVAEVD